MIRMINVSKSYGNHKILDSLSFDFQKGKNYILSAPSGTGKTTLLEILAGIDKKHSGSVYYTDNENPSASDNPQERRVPVASLSFQGGNLLPWLSAIDNVLIADHEKAERKRAEAMLSAAGIKDFSKFPDEMSGGMQNRVGIVRALMKDADVYLLDEPFAGLDSASIAAISEVIRDNTVGKTVIAVIHDSVSFILNEKIRIGFDGSPVKQIEIIEEL